MIDEKYLELTRQLEEKDRLIDNYKKQCLELMKFQEEVEKVILVNGTPHFNDTDYTIYCHQITKESNPKLHALCRKIVPIRISTYYSYPSIEDVKYWIYALDIKVGANNILVRNIENLKLPSRFHSAEEFYKWIIESDELKSVRQMTNTKHQEIVEAAKKMISKVEEKHKAFVNGNYSHCKAN